GLVAPARWLRPAMARGEGRAPPAPDLDEEFSTRKAHRTDHLLRSGMAPADASRRARLEFGSVERYREESRQARGLRLYDELRSDLHYAARSLFRHPMFSIIAVLTLPLGVGSHAAVFSHEKETLLQPLP